MPSTAASSWSGGCPSACTRRRSAAALGAQVDYVDTDENRLAAAEKLGAVVHDRAKPDKSWDPYPVTVHTSADPALLAATLRATWPDGVCTDTGIYYQAVEMPLLPMYTRGRAIRDRPGQRAGGHPRGPRIARRGMRSVARGGSGRALGGRAVGVADDDRQDGVHSRGVAAYGS